MDYLLEFLQSFSKFPANEAHISIQFQYDFSSFQITNLRKLVKQANQMQGLSGISYNHQLEITVTSELFDFLTNFKSNLMQQWFRLGAFAFPAIGFVLFVIWLVFSYNRNKLSDTFINFMTRGFPKKIIIQIFLLSRLLYLVIACLLSLAISFPITYLIISILSVFLQNGYLTLNLVSFGAVFLPILVLFLILLFYSYCNLLFLNKQIKHFFPDRLQSFNVSKNQKSNIQNIASILIGLFSIAGIISILVIGSYLRQQLGNNYQISFIVNVFLYVLLSILSFSFFAFFVNTFLKKITFFGASIWRRFSKRFSIILHNFSLSFKQHKKQAIFLALILCLLLPSFLISSYYTQYAFDSAHFSIGSDMVVYLENPNETSAFLSDLSSQSYIQSAANYSIYQTVIFDKNYQLLVLSENFSQTFFYSNDISYGITLGQLLSFQKKNDSLLIHSRDQFLENRITNVLNQKQLVLGFNNKSAGFGNYIGNIFDVYGSFYRFPTFLDDQKLLTYENENPVTNIPFIITSEICFQNKILSLEDITLISIQKGIIIKLNNGKQVRQIQNELKGLSYTFNSNLWIDNYLSYFPPFAASILSLCVLIWIFIALSSIFISIVLVQNVLKSRMDKVLVLRYRGFSENSISKIFLVEHMLILFTITPFGIGIGFGLTFFAIRRLIKPNVWTIVIPYYARFTWMLIGIILIIEIIELVIRYFLMKRFLSGNITKIGGT
jgi:hypothetical protein